jgi:shikimate dehydrogenase
LKKFYSLSKFPGLFGKYYYTKFFEYYNIDAVYNPIGVNDLYPLIKDLMISGADGISVSMPYKKEVLKYLDSTNICALEYQSCNTILNTNNGYEGYNTDIYGCKLFLEYFEKNTIILGNGSIGNMLSTIANKNNLEHNLCSRSLNNWDERHNDCDVLINCTAMGTIDTKSPIENIPISCKVVLDVSLKENDLYKKCLDSNVKYISGLEFYKKQFCKQFQIYTSIDPDMEYFDYLTKNKI